MKQVLKSLRQSRLIIGRVTYDPNVKKNNRMKLKICAFITMFLICIGNIYSQTQQLISGTVTEMYNNQAESLIGVNVAVENSQNRVLGGTVTNQNGQYNLKIPDGENNLTIVFSYIGMETQRIKYAGQKQLNILMASNSKQIAEVVITSKAIDRNDLGISETEMVSATQKLEVSKLVETMPVISIEEILQGQMAGLDIIAGGNPGTKSTMRIRGTGTLNASADPLIVIDGVPYTESKAEDFDFSNANEEDLGALLNLSPADIESVEVLKDASATAIWGTQGANGVLVIKTKRGKMGKTNFNLTSKLSMKFEPKTIPMLNGDEYTALMQESIWNTANYVGIDNASTYLRLLFDTPEIGYTPDWKYFNEYNQDTDWLDEIRQKAYTVENNFSMSGGGGKARYRMSLGYVTDLGTTIGTSLDKFSATSNIDYQFSDKLRFGADFSFTQSDQDANWASNARSEAFGKMPNKSPYMIDRTTGRKLDEYFVYQGLLWEGAFSSNDSGSNASNYNPVAMVNEATKKTGEKNTKITLSVAEWKILPELTYQSYVSIAMSSVKVMRFLPQVVTAVAWTSKYANQSYQSYSESLSIKTENRLNFRKNWNEKHNLIANAIFRTAQATSSKYVSASSGMASSGMSDPVVGANVQIIGSGESEGRSLSATGLVNYSLLSRYVIQGSISAESNSAMGREQRMGYFPGAGISWNIQNEPFLRTINRKWLDEFKLRFSVGQSGRAPSGNSIYLGAFGAKENYMSMPSIGPTRIQLDNLKWETNTEYDVGVDLSFFQGRLSFNADYYKRYSTDLLQKEYTIPSTTGFSEIAWYNSGKMENQGWEFRGDVMIFNNKDWTIKANANISRNENVYTEMPTNMKAESGVAESDANMKPGQYATRVVEGRPLGSFFGYRYKGVYSDTESTYARDVQGNIMNDADGNPIVMKNGTYTCFPGDAQYEDINHDGVINKYDIVYLGNSQPVLTGGFGINIKYKQVSLNTFFHGRFGQSIVNAARMDNESMYGKRNQSTAVLRRWQKEGDITDIPRALYQQGLNCLGSDRFVEDVSFVRLKTLTLTYTFPKNVVRAWGLGGLNLFVTGYNLYTWTDYTGQDPEVSMPSGNALAKDGATTPVSMRVACGFNLNF